MSKPPRFLHIFPSFEPGGSQLRMATIINSLGSSVSHGIMAINGNFTAAYKLDPGIEVEMIPPPPKRRTWSLPFALLRRIKRFGPDLLLTYNWGAIDAVLGARLGTRIPVIHNECGFNIDEARRLRTSRVVMRRLLLRTIRCTVVTSRSMLRIALKEFHLPRARVRFIQSGVDAQRFRPARNIAWRESHGVGDSELLFGYVGGLRPVKNLNLLLRSFAAAGLPNSRLVLFGDGPCRSELEELVRSCRMSEKVLFAGYVRDPPPCYAALDVFVMSSVSEQTPNALLEAMACGLPALCTNVGDVSALLAASEPPAVVAVNDEAAFAESMRVLASQADLRRSWGERNRKRCLEHYSVERMVREYAALYRNVIPAMNA